MDDETTTHDSFCESELLSPEGYWTECDCSDREAEGLSPEDEEQMEREAWQDERAKELAAEEEAVTVTLKRGTLRTLASLVTEAIDEDSLNPASDYTDEDRAEQERFRQEMRLVRTELAEQGVTADAPTPELELVVLGSPVPGGGLRWPKLTVRMDKAHPAFEEVVPGM